MSDALLKTKLHVPKPRPGLIGRTRLLERLDEGLFIGKPFSLVAAPAGYGKTTLVANWFEQTDCPQAWVSLDEQDNDPIKFFSYLIAALQTVDSNMGQEAAKLLYGSGLLPVQAVMFTLVNELLAKSEQIILVLDDFYVIKNESILLAIQTLLDHHPPCLHLVMITREDPALSLPRLRVRNQITEIRMNDLRFDLAETEDFFTISAGLNLNNEEIMALEARTEGWVAGLQLAALSIKGWSPQQANKFIKTFSGNHRYIIDYLMEEVIKRTDSETRMFLVHTAVVDRFNVELGDALTNQCNAKRIIFLLEQANLFLIPLDSECHWYRYHHLFTEFLRTELSKSERVAVQQRAAHWFANNGFPEEGIKYALAAEVYDFASDLLKTIAANVFQRGEIVTLLDWLNSLPAKLVDTSGDLASYKAWSLFLLGKSEEAMHFLQRTEQNQLDNSDSLAEGRLLALRGWIANYCENPHTKEIALLAIEKIGERDPFFREIALLSLGHAQRKNDPIQESTSTLYLAYETARNARHMFTCLASLLDITMNLVIQGERRESIALCNHALDQYVNRQGKTLPMAELLYIPLGILQYEGNKLEQSRYSLEQGIRASHRVGLNRILGGDAEQTLALVYWALGDKQKAWDLLQNATVNLDTKAFPIIWDRYKAFEAHLSLKQGDYAVAMAWVESSGLNHIDSISSLKEIPYLVMARTLYRTGLYDQALMLLNTIQQFDRERGRYGRLVYVNIVSSLVLQALGRKEEAVKFMDEAVNFSAKEGYVRPFLCEGPEVIELLLAVKSTNPDFLASLLGYFTQHPERPYTPLLSTSSLSNSQIIDSLSSRELEVLKLLAIGLSNKDIGVKLFISLGTVKWHVKNIYSKLGVASRTQAVAYAQKLGLLGITIPEK